MTTKPAPLEAITVITICFGWFIASSIDAVMNGFPDGRRFSDENLTSLLVVELIFGGVALLFLHLRKHDLAQLIPTPTWSGSLIGVLLYALTLIVCGLVGEAFTSGPSYDQPIERMLAFSSPSLMSALSLSIVNGLFEEVFLLGYLARGFMAVGAGFAIGLSLLVRVLYHLYQGPVGAVMVFAFGLVVSVFYWRTRLLWPVVVTHIITDVIALT